jgi:hypothetical protein
MRMSGVRSFESARRLARCSAPRRSLHSSSVRSREPLRTLAELTREHAVPDGHGVGLNRPRRSIVLGTAARASEPRVFRTGLPTGVTRDSVTS